MYYKVIRQFGPSSGAEWTQYAAWRGLSGVSRFDSIDGILRPDLFSPVSQEDWDHCVQADLRTSLLKDGAYAQRVAGRIPGAVVVGVVPGVTEDTALPEGVVGFDLLDGDEHVSLLTNWGSDPAGLIRPYLSSNAIVSELRDAMALHALLLARFPEDPHVCGSSIWAVVDCAPLRAAATT